MTRNDLNLAEVRSRILGPLLLLVLALAWSPAPHLQAADCNSIRVLTFNLRFDGGQSTCISDCDNIWYKGEGNNPARRDVAKAYLLAIDPDIFGLQEVRNPPPFIGLVSSQLLDVIGWFPGHDHYELDRGDGEHCAIFYRKSRFLRTAAGTFWLSCTPDQQSLHPLEKGNFRIVSWVFLIDLHTSTPFYVFNTHWPLNPTARQYSAALIRDRIAQIAGDRPALLLGDLNCDNTDPEFAILQRRGGYPGSAECSASPSAFGVPGPQLIDSYAEVNPVVSTSENTHHGFSAATTGSRIDHILHTRGFFEPWSAAIRRETYPGGCGDPECYPSDHYGVEVNFRALLPDVYVNFAWSESECESGSALLPFNSLPEALETAKANATITLRNNSGRQAITLNPKRGPVTLTSIGGPSTVGK